MADRDRHKVLYRYQGQPTEHYHGVPDRDLTVEDVAQLTDEQRAVIDAGALYTRTRAVEPETPPDPLPAGLTEPALTPAKPEPKASAKPATSNEVR